MFKNKLSREALYILDLTISEEEIVVYNVKDCSGPMPHQDHAMSNISVLAELKSPGTEDH